MCSSPDTLQVLRMCSEQVIPVGIEPTMKAMCKKPWQVYSQSADNLFMPDLWYLYNVAQDGCELSHRVRAGKIETLMFSAVCDIIRTRPERLVSSVSRQLLGLHTVFSFAHFGSVCVC